VQRLHWGPWNGRQERRVAVWLQSLQALMCVLSVQPIDCTFALVCDVERRCSPSCRLWRYISVQPFTWTLNLTNIISLSRRIAGDFQPCRCDDVQLHVLWRLRGRPLWDEHRRLSGQRVSEQRHVHRRGRRLHLQLSAWIHRYSGRLLKFRRIS